MRHARLALVLIQIASFCALSGGWPPALAAGSGSSQLPPWLAQVRFIWHGLSVAPPRQSTERGKLKESLYNAYGLSTTTLQRASIGFRDGTTIHMDERTDATLQSSHVTYVRNGQVAEYLAPGSDHRVQTATATASAIGTTYLVQAAGGHSNFIVLHGALQVSSTVGSSVKTVVVKSNQESTTTQNAPPSKPRHVNAAKAFAWTDQIPTPDLGEDVSLDANGGSIVSSSSQRQGLGGRFAVKHIHDGLLSEGWESGDGQTTNQWVKIGFFAGNLFRLASVIIDPAATHGDSPAADLRQFEIRVSSTGTDDRDFTTIFRGTCKQAAGLQKFDLPTQVLARYVELRAIDNYGDKQHIAVAEFEAVANETSLAYPWGAALDKSGNIYVADLGNDRIVKLSPKGVQLDAWGTKGHGPGQFVVPWAVAVDAQGEIYVADTGNNRIQKLSSSGQPLLQWGSYGRGIGQFNRPAGISLDSAGNVYVSDTFNNRIQKFSPTGQPLAQWGSTGTAPGQFSSVYDVSVASNGTIVVADAGNDRIVKLRPSGQVVGITHLPFAPWRVNAGPNGDVYISGGQVTNFAGLVYLNGDVTGPPSHLEKLTAAGALVQWGKTGSGRGKFLYPTGLVTNSKDQLFAVDSANNRIIKLSSKGHVLDQYGLFGTVSQLLTQPYALATDSAGTLYVTDIRMGRVQVRSPDGSVTAVWGKRGWLKGNKTSGLSTFAFPGAVATDGKGTIYLADSENSRVVKLTADGPVAAFTRTGIGDATFQQPAAVTVDRSGTVYVGDCNVQAKYARIVKLAPDGKPLGSLGSYGSGSGQFECAGGLAIDSSGNIWLTDEGNCRVLKLAPDGRQLASYGALGTFPGQFTLPQGIALDAAGNVYIADGFNNRIQKLSPNGTVLKVWGTFGPENGNFNLPVGITVDPQGNVYVADYNNLRIQVFTSDGTYLRTLE